MSFRREFLEIAEAVEDFLENNDVDDEDFVQGDQDALWSYLSGTMEPSNPPRASTSSGSQRRDKTITLELNRLEHSRKTLEGLVVIAHMESADATLKDNSGLASKLTAVAENIQYLVDTLAEKTRQVPRITTPATIARVDELIKIAKTAANTFKAYCNECSRLINRWTTQLEATYAIEEDAARWWTNATLKRIGRLHDIVGNCTYDWAISNAERHDLDLRLAQLATKLHESLAVPVPETYKQFKILIAVAEQLDEIFKKIFNPDEGAFRPEVQSESYQRSVIEKDFLKWIGILQEHSTETFRSETDECIANTLVLTNLQLGLDLIRLRPVRQCPDKDFFYVLDLHDRVKQLDMPPSLSTEMVRAEATRVIQYLKYRLASLKRAIGDLTVQERKYWFKLCEMWETEFKNADTDDHRTHTIALYVTDLASNMTQYPSNTFLQLREELENELMLACYELWDKAIGMLRKDANIRAACYQDQWKRAVMLINEKVHARSVIRKENPSREEYNSAERFRKAMMAFKPTGDELLEWADSMRLFETAPDHRALCLATRFYSTISDWYWRLLSQEVRTALPLTPAKSDEKELLLTRLKTNLDWISADLASRDFDDKYAKYLAFYVDEWPKLIVAITTRTNWTIDAYEHYMNYRSDLYCPFDHSDCTEIRCDVHQAEKLDWPNGEDRKQCRDIVVKCERHHNHHAATSRKFPLVRLCKTCVRIREATYTPIPAIQDCFCERLAKDAKKWKMTVCPDCHRENSSDEDRNIAIHPVTLEMLRHRSAPLSATTKPRAMDDEICACVRMTYADRDY